MENDITAAVSAIQRLAGTVLPLMTLAAGVGVVAMALIQMLKEALYLRAIYHRWRFRRWAQNHWGNSHVAVRNDIVDIVSGGSEFSLFGQSASEFSQRIRMAVQLALTDLKNHRGLAEVLSSPELIAKLEQSNSPEPATTPEGILAMTLANRKIDALELSFSHWWRFWLRISATVVSGAIIGYGLTRVEGDWDGIAFVIIVLTGGLVAPVAKDVVSAIEGLRQRGDA